MNKLRKKLQNEDRESEIVVEIYVQCNVFSFFVWFSFFFIWYCICFVYSVYSNSTISRHLLYCSICISHEFLSAGPSCDYLLSTPRQMSNSHFQQKLYKTRKSALRGTYTPGWWSPSPPSPSHNHPAHVHP